MTGVQTCALPIYLLERRADEDWEGLGGPPGAVAMAVEGEEFDLREDGLAE